MNDLPEQIITRPEELVACCQHLAAAGSFGFDTEFVGEDTFHPRLCLVQVATRDQLYLIDPLTVGPLDAFWQLVTDPAVRVIVHAGREEVRLCRLWTGRTPTRLFDLQIAAGLVGLAYPLGYATLVGQVLGIGMAKGETRTEWRHRPLTPQQIRYAYDDVRYLLPLAERIDDRLQQLGRQAWALEECTRLTANGDPEGPAPEKWRKLRGVGSLDRRRLAIVRELSQWREEVASRTNRPARVILRDDLIVEIARRNPSRERDLQVVRGLGHRDLASIMEAVQRARAQPPESFPELSERKMDPPQISLVTNVLLAVLGDFCSRHRLAANLVANTQDVRLLVRAHYQRIALPEASSLAHGWRQQFILPELQAVLGGRRTLRIGDLTSEAPLAVEEHPGEQQAAE